MTTARTAYKKQVQFISGRVRDIESADSEEDIEGLQEEHSIQLEIFHLVAKPWYLEHIVDNTAAQVASAEEKTVLDLSMPLHSRTDDRM